MPHRDQFVQLVETPYYGFDNKGPSYVLKHPNGGYGHTVQVDPAPCYPHNVLLVHDELYHLQQVAPLHRPLAIFAISNEDLGRTNAWCTQDFIYNKREDGTFEDRQPVTIIMLNGKRIPPHPAMTRYLVAHEYGHAVNDYLVDRWNYTDDQFDQMYMKRFRPDAGLLYGCGKWHHNIGEMIANDFRILVAERELEFWPHETPRPEEVPGLKKFWKAVQNQLISEDKRWQQ